MSTIHRGNRLIVALFLAVLPVSLAGCSGSGGSSTTSTPLSKAQFVARVSAICQTVGKEIEPKLEAAAHGKPPASRSRGELEKVAETVVIPIYRKVIAELSEVNPPPGDRRGAKILAEFEATLKKAEAEPVQLLDNDPFQAADRESESYGIEGCIF